MKHVLNSRLTFWVLYNAADEVGGAEGGDGGQSDLVGERDPQVGYGVREQHALLRLFTSQVYLLPQQVLRVLDWWRGNMYKQTQGGDISAMNMIIECIWKQWNRCRNTEKQKIVYYKFYKDLTTMMMRMMVYLRVPLFNDVQKLNLNCLGKDDG